MPPGPAHQMLVNLVRRCLDGTLRQHVMAGPHLPDVGGLIILDELRRQSEMIGLRVNCDHIDLEFRFK